MQHMLLRPLHPNTLNDNSTTAQQHNSTTAQQHNRNTVGTELQVNTDTLGYWQSTVAALNAGTLSVFFLSTLSFCGIPQQCFDPSSQGVYNSPTETVSNKADISSGVWPHASIVATAILDVTTVVGWHLYLYTKCAPAPKAAQQSHQTIEMNEGDNFARNIQDPKAAPYIIGTPLHAFLPTLIMNLQMQMSNAAQTIEDQATWLTSLFEGKEAHLDETLENIVGFPCPYQGICFENQSFDFLSANDASPSYDYCNFG